MTTLKYFGYFAAAAMTIAVVLNWGDLRRYVKIEMM